MRCENNDRFFHDGHCIASESNDDYWGKPYLLPTRTEQPFHPAISTDSHAKNGHETATDLPLK